MAALPFPRWLDKARATGARLISPHEPSDARQGAPSKANAKTKASTKSATSRRGQHSLDTAAYADIPPFLLPLDLRVRLDKDERERNRKAFRSVSSSSLSQSRSRAAPYDKSVPRKRALKLQMPSMLKRLAGPPSCPIVVAQYKDEFRGVGHEEDLHWALIVITDPATLSGPSFQAYAQKKRRPAPRPARERERRTSSRAGPAEPNTVRGTADAAGVNTTIRTRTLSRSVSAAPEPSPSRSPSSPSSAPTPTPTPTPAAGPGPALPARAEGPEYDVQWYARHAPASLFDVCATVRTLCLGGVQVGAVRAADVGKLTEYLRSHPPVPRGAGWGAREYVLELLELLRPFKLLRADLQGLGARTRRGPSAPLSTSECGSVRVEDLLPELREVGRATQESIFNDDFRPCVKVYS